MGTREIYFKNKYLCEIPIGIIYYIIEDKNKVIQLGNSLWVDFREDDINIDNMKKIEKTNGFMFWNKSINGELFLKDNHKEIAESFIKFFKI